MNDRDMFHLILDQVEPDFPSVVDAAVADGKRVRRRRRIAVLGSAAAVLAIAAAGLALVPSNHETVGPATPLPVSVLPRPTPASNLPLPVRPAPSILAPEVSESAGPRTPIDDTGSSVEPSAPQPGKNEKFGEKYGPSRPLRCTAAQLHDDCGAKNGS
jgi:hypothetical protein